MRIMRRKNVSNEDIKVVTPVADIDYSRYGNFFSLME